MKAGLESNTPSGGLARVAGSNPVWPHGGDMATELPTTLRVQANPERVTLATNPAAATEHNSQRATPRCAKFGDQTHSRGVHQNSELSFGVGTPKASACAQDTRLGMPGQRTGRVRRTQGRAGVQS